ncbi:MAG TPA: heavy metal-binding domain-containing protein, partial [Burkholderiales bacterium]
MTLDPVCGMKVDPAKAAGRVDHQGKTYFFCSPHCVAKFKSEPAAYVAPRQDQAAKPAPASGKYTCPMHPEIVQEGPGSCPKCGMALVPMLPVAPPAAEYTCPMHPEVR